MIVFKAAAYLIAKEQMLLSKFTPCSSLIYNQFTVSAEFESYFFHPPFLVHRPCFQSVQVLPIFENKPSVMKNFTKNTRPRCFSLAYHFTWNVR